MSPQSMDRMPGVPRFYGFVFSFSSLTFLAAVTSDNVQIKLHKKIAKPSSHNSNVDKVMGKGF